jgi:hypothetical protein
MHGVGRARMRWGRLPRGRVLAAGLAAAGVVLAVVIYVIVAAAPGSTPRASGSGSPGDAGSTRPMAAASHAGSLLLDDSGADLSSWLSRSTCTNYDYSANGKVSTDPGGNIMLTTTGGENSCAALASPQTYKSVVIETEIDLPAYPGRPSTVANWDAFWLTDAARWPEDGELDAVETPPPTGVNAVSWHSGTGTNHASFNVSTGDNSLPAEGSDLTPGWHTIDVVYTKGYFAVYYDGSLYTSFTSQKVTGDPLTIYFTTDVYPQEPNADSSPATVKMRYLKIWAYK